MNRSLSARLAKLEAARRVDPVILHFEDGNKTPMAVNLTLSGLFPCPRPGVLS